MRRNAVYFRLLLGFLMYVARVGNGSAAQDCFQAQECFYLQNVFMAAGKSLRFLSAPEMIRESVPVKKRS